MAFHADLAALLTVSFAVSRASPTVDLSPSFSVAYVRLKERGKLVDWNTADDDNVGTGKLREARARGVGEAEATALSAARRRENLR